jgi:hypothetical protein
MSYIASTEQTEMAARHMRIAALYDSMRLQTYKECEHLGEKIRTLCLGAATALRFDDVGYFNRIYAPDDSIVDKFQEIEQFYAGCPFPCELVGPPDSSSERVDEGCRARGWTPAKRYAWVSAPVSELIIPRQVPRNIAVRPVNPANTGEKNRFLQCYLRAFEANPKAFDAAISNMCHLFKRPELNFLMAWIDKQPAGVGMSYRAGSIVFLCAGATVPEFRNQGCHTALLAARFRAAILQGCEEVFSWAVEGGQSHADMEGLGLATVGVTRAWKYDAQGREPD